MFPSAACLSHNYLTANTWSMLPLSLLRSHRTQQPHSKHSVHAHYPSWGHTAHNYLTANTLSMLPLTLLRSHRTQLPHSKHLVHAPSIPPEVTLHITTSQQALGPCTVYPSWTTPHRTASQQTLSTCALFPSWGYTDLPFLHMLFHLYIILLVCILPYKFSTTD